MRTLQAKVWSGCLAFLVFLFPTVVLADEYDDLTQVALRGWQEGKYDVAIEFSSRAINLDPTFPSAYLVRAGAYCNKKLYDKAICDCDVGLLLEPKNPANDIPAQRLDRARMHWLRGLAYHEGRKDYGQAIRDYKKSTVFNPDHASFHNSLAWLLATCPNEKYRNGQEALEHAKKACELKRDADNLDTLAAAFAECGEFDQAVSWQQKAIRVIKASDTSDLNEYRERLELYKQKKAYRQK